MVNLWLMTVELWFLIVVTHGSSMISPLVDEGYDLHGASPMIDRVKLGLSHGGFSSRRGPQKWMVHYSK